MSRNINLPTTDVPLPVPAKVEWFDVLGRKVSHPYGHGLYFMRVNGKTRKIVWHE